LVAIIHWVFLRISAEGISFVNEYSLKPKFMIEQDHAFAVPIYIGVG
jgi:hypothetical protein